MLTYNQKYRKTYDTLCLLKARGYSNIRVYGQPMTYIKKKYPLIEHRPEQNMFIPEPEVLCTNLGFEYIEGNFEKTITDRHIYYLLCGAGLLDKEFVKCHRIINAHPGYIPFKRGLDAYKWSIYYGLPLEVTTYFFSDYINVGEIIDRREIKLKEYDTFHSVAQRMIERVIKKSGDDTYQKIRG